MLRRYFRETFHLLHLVLLKPLTLAEERERLSRKERRLILLKVLSVISMLGLGMLRAHIAVVDHTFYWLAVFTMTLLGGLLIGLLIGLIVALNGGVFVRLSVGMNGESSGGVLGALFGVLGGVLFGALFNGLIGGVLGAFFGGLGGGLGGALYGRPVIGVFSGPVIGLNVGLFIGMFGELLIEEGMERGFSLAVLQYGSFLFWYPFVVFLLSLRLFYWPCQVVQYYRAKHTADPFPLFQNSPVYWDEVITWTPPFLTSWLVRLVDHNRERGLAEILFVASKRPLQRPSAQKALITLALRELEQLDSLEKLVTAGQIVEAVPADTEYLLYGFADIRRRLDTIARTVQGYLTRVTPTGRMKLLQELQGELVTLQNMAALSGSPVWPSFLHLTRRWLDLVEQEQTECQKQLASTPLPNPFVAGNPLQPRDHGLFKGRRDIVAAIEEYIINPDRSTTLLFYGRRRIGKTSTLLNLPRLLGSQFVPVFIDLQDAKWRESDAVFCYQLARSLTNELRAQQIRSDLKEPQLEQFKPNPFTTLGEALDHLEEIARQLEKSILLTFDEYERLEAGLETGKLTIEILNQLRHIVQHREGITVLFSGSHRFEELRGIAWSDYLINVKTLELSFLPAEDARSLLTEPVPKLTYQPGAIEKVLVLTHCQPYLLQAVAFELVNSLNSKNKREARVEDIEAAAEKVLVAAQGYFYHTWQEECSEQEKAVLRTLATNGTASLSSSQGSEAVRSLCHKDILEKVGQQPRFTIELFRRWIVNNQNISQRVRQSA